MTGPYAAAADTYWQAGWRGILPLPAARKKPPPDGWTGHGAPYPSYPDITAWVEDRGGGNVALRLPADILGVDVDAYDNKPGAHTLAGLVAEHGPLPATWTSTSRDDGISGIRLFKVPVGMTWVDSLPGIETIHKGHRYLVVAPSIHPDTDRKYTWTAPDGKVGDQPPAPAGLPELPLAWAAALARPHGHTDPADLDSGQAGDWLRQLRGGAHCPPVELTLNAAVQLLTNPAGGSRHDITRSASRALAAFGGEGHAGTSDALAQLGRAFTAAAANPAHGGHTRDTDTARGEYRDLLVGAIRLAAAGNPTPGQQCDCATDADLFNLVGQAPPPGASTNTPDPGPVDNRPPLNVTNTALAADWLRDHLGRGPLAGYLLRGDELVHTPREGEDGYIPLTPDERDSDGPAQIRAVTAAGLAASISYRYAPHRTITTKNGNGTTRPVLFPTPAATTAVNALDMMRHLRRLRGVIHTPVVRVDGTILDRPGYDPGTRLLHLPDPDLQLPPIPDQPTSEQLAAAVGLLTEMTAGFPFLTDHDRTNFYGALLTPLIRLLTPPPYKLVAIGAPMPGSGKSLLAAILRIVHGGVFRAEMPEDGAELRKQITAILDITTAPVVQFDNVTGVLSSSIMAGLLTSDRWDDRRLGTGEWISRPNARLWVLTGNNLHIGGDLPRRTVWCTIDPAMPDPHLRTGFAIGNLEVWAREHRGEIIVALLTLVRGWVQAGMPQPAPERSDSYTRWVTTLRGILTHADIPGVFDHPDSAQDTAAEDEWGTFLDAIHRAFAGELWTAGELLDRVDIVHAASIPLDAFPGDLSERISRAKDARSVARTLGMWLRNREGRWANKKAVRDRGKRENVQLWQIVTYEPRSTGTTGTTGTSSKPGARENLNDLGSRQSSSTDREGPRSPRSPLHDWADW